MFSFPFFLTLSERLDLPDRVWLSDCGKRTLDAVGSGMTAAK